MFFPRLRRQAKWVFVFLAFVFALSFVFFGVGSGSGIGDLLRGNFNIFGNNGSSTSSSAVNSALKKTQAHPKDPGTFSPGDPGVAIAGPYDRSFADFHSDSYLDFIYASGFGYFKNRQQVAEAQSLQGQAPLTLAGVIGVSSATPVGQMLSQDTSSQQLVQKANVAFTDANTALQKDAQLYKRIAKLQPTDVNTQFHYAQLADLTGDTAAAVTAYKKVIQLAPTDPSAQQARQRIAVLAPAKHG